MSRARRLTIGRATTRNASSVPPCRPRCRRYRSITRTKRAKAPRPRSEMSLAHRFEGGCHCVNRSFVFEATAGLETLGLRADQCSFCRAHAARNTSDPNGTMRIEVRDETKLSRYRFGLKTAEFLLCRNCGVYIGALMEDGGHLWFTVNVNTFL